jgi:uncharacterized membrane protein
MTDSHKHKAPVSRKEDNNNDNTPYEIGKIRIESFSDGVIAIIITLMILEVKIPDFKDNLTGVQTWVVMSKVLPELSAYILSFTLLGTYWVNHHHFFHAIKTTDRNILWWNLNLLFWLSILPLPTYLLAQHPMRPEATALYGLNVMLASLSFTLMGHYARRKNLMLLNLAKRRRKKLNIMNWAGIALYFVSIFTGYISVYISYVIFLIIPAMYFIPQKIELEKQ